MMALSPPHSYPLVITDGGRGQSEHHFNEKNDCVVRAFAIYLDWSYDRAHTYLMDWGRNNRRKTKQSVWIPCLIREYVRRWPNYMVGHRRTFKNLLRDEPRGSYIVEAQHHLVVVKEGVVYDNGFIMRPGAIVKSVWSRSHNFVQ